MAEKDHEPSRLEQFRDIVALDPDDYFSHFGYASALFDVGRYPESVLEFREAIRLKPDYSAAFRDLGRGYVAGVPVLTLWAVGGTLFAALILDWTELGRRIRAGVGDAVRLRGSPPARITLLCAKLVNLRAHPVRTIGAASLRRVSRVSTTNL